MTSKRQVEGGSGEWSTVDYRIQTITGKSSIQILNLYRYPGARKQDFKTEGVLQVTDFDRQYIERVGSNSLPTQEMIFYCGHVNIHSQIRPNKIFTFLLCRLDLGKIGTIKDEVSLADSILLESDSEKDAFQYNFMINNQQKYQIEYEAHFVIGTEKEFLENQYECMNCQNKRAKVHCLNQLLNLCEECSKDHHSRRIMNGHELQKLDKVNSLPSCQKHALKLTYYCSRCCQYLCAVCLQKGNSHGNADHPVSPIADLYEVKKEETEVVSARQRDKLNHLMRNLEVKKEEIEENYQQTKKILDTIYQRSLNNLNRLYHQKSSLIKSDQIQLKMMSQKLEWTRTFIRFQEKNLKPTFYFQSQDKFSSEIGNVRVSQFSSVFSLKADLAVEGDLLVGHRDQMEAPLRNEPQPERISHAQETERGQSRTLQKKRTVFEYDSLAEVPLRGQLNLMLDNTQLNFFCGKSPDIQ